MRHEIRCALATLAPQIDAIRAALANEKVAAANARRVDTETAITVGEELWAASQMLSRRKTGVWLEFLRLVDIKEATSRRYMRMFDIFGRHPELRQLAQYIDKSALDLITDTATPTTARDKAIAWAREGRRVKAAMVKALIKVERGPVAEAANNEEELGVIMPPLVRAVSRAAHKFRLLLDQLDIVELGVLEEMVETRLPQQLRREVCTALECDYYVVAEPEEEEHGWLTPAEATEEKEKAEELIYAALDRRQREREERLGNDIEGVGGKDVHAAVLNTCVAPVAEDDMSMCANG